MRSGAENALKQIEQIKAGQRDRACVVELVDRSVDGSSYSLGQLKAILAERDTLEVDCSLAIPCNLGSCGIVLALVDGSARPVNCSRYPEIETI